MEEDIAYHGNRFKMILNQNGEEVWDIVDTKKKVPEVIIKIIDRKDETVAKTCAKNIKEIIKGLESPKENTFIEPLPEDQEKHDCDLCILDYSKHRYVRGSLSRVFPILVCKECSKNLKRNLKEAIDKNELEIISRQI